jgi:hypothetical protein
MAQKIDDTTLSAGQNEGIERAVLPLPQLAFVLNARLRKAGRWGKRWGKHTISAAKLSSTPGFPRCFGPGFALIDDQCNLWDQTVGDFVSVPSTAQQRFDGTASGWLPDRVFFPSAPRAIQLQNATPCATCFALGYLWTAEQVGDPLGVAGSQMLRIAAVERHDQTVVFSFDLRGAGGGAGIHHPRLVLMGGTLALFYADAGAGDAVRGRTLTSLSIGFGAEVNVTGPGAVGFDAYPWDAASCLFAVCYGNAVTSGRLNNLLAQIGTADIAEANPVTSVSIVGAPGTPVYVGYGMPATPASKVRVYATPGGAIVGTVTLSTTDGARPLLVPLQAGGVRAVFSALEFSGFNALLVGAFNIVDVTPLAALNPSIGIRRAFGTIPISAPFAVGADVYIWTQQILQQPITGGAGFPVLLRLPAPASYGSATIYCPVELSAQDFVTATGQGRRVIDLQGLPVVSRIGTSATWAALHPILFRAPATTADILIGFRVVQATHYTDTPQRRGIRSFPCDNSHLIPMGTLTRIDAYGAVETGFAHAPAMTCVAGGAGGGLTPSKTYYYSAVFTSRNELGRVELSAPSAPVKVVMGGTDTKVTLSITWLFLTAKKDAQIEIYRTLADGQTFYLVATVMATPFDSGPAIVYTDVLADTAIATSPVIYTQVGQQLANAFPPASRFGCTGGGRAFLGGLLRGDTWRASKLILGDQPATFCESDAFTGVIPADLTGLAWMDSLVAFTAEGIYVSTGEGPTDDGNGDFGTPSRLPFPIGCIEPRSVITVPEGTFFQSNRGLYLLPRGFGEPIAAGDVVMDTLADFPTITGAVAMVKPTEQTIRWTCLGDDGEQGRQIVYDLVHKAWSIDQHHGSPSGDVCAGEWLNNEIISAPMEIGFGAPRVTDDTFSDTLQPITMTLRTGDIRPFGTQSRGPVQRFGVLTELRSPCTLEVTRSTDRGGQLAERVFTGIAPDDEVGDQNYTQVDLGSLDMRSIVVLSVQVTEESDGEGLAFIALSIERGTSDGLRLEKPADRIV